MSSQQLQFGKKVIDTKLGSRAAMHTHPFFEVGLDQPVSDKLIAIGEVGLGGEVRSVPNLEQRLREAERIGFERAVVPKHSLAHLNPADYPGMKLVGAAYIADAIHALKNDRL